MNTSRALLADLDRRGYTVKKTRGGRFQVTGAGLPIVFVSVSPTDHRAYANACARLRRSGYRI